MYYRVPVCTTECQFVPQSTSLYYTAPVCTTEHQCVLQSTSLYHRVAVCTTEYQLVLQSTSLYYEYHFVLQSTSLYYRIPFPTTAYQFVLQSTSLYYFVLRSTILYYFVLRGRSWYHTVFFVSLACFFSTRKRDQNEVREARFSVVMDKCQTRSSRNTVLYFTTSAFTAQPVCTTEYQFVLQSTSLYYRVPVCTL